MERACLMTKDGQFTANAVQLFSVELVGSDARKRLLLDFDSIAPRLSSALTRLENFEGDDVRAGRQRHADAADRCRTTISAPRRRRRSCCLG